LILTRQTIPEAKMQCKAKLNNGVLEVQMAGRFTFNDNNIFRPVLDNIAKEGIRCVVFDIGQTEYMDSAALGMLLLARDEAERNSCSIVLKSPQGYIKKLFTVSKFYEMFNIEE